MKINLRQKKVIHTLKGALKLDDDTYRAVLAGYGVASSVELSYSLAEKLIDDLAAKAQAVGVWERRPGNRGHKGKPKNIEGHKSRAQQLQKIQALLTVGKRPWSYADILAQKICKVDLVAWVPGNELYKVIAALWKQAKREGWDLREEKRV